MAEAREVPARSFLSKLRRGDGRPSEFRRWVSANWAALFMLFFIFLLALFVRSYFGFAMAQDNGYIVSGGSDSYYWRRIIDYSSDTGKQLYWDPLPNYPDGIRNPRPPFFSMSIVVPAVLAQDLFKSLDDAIGFTFLWSTAFWGALTVIPTYFLGKEVFGRRAGLVAAFFLAVMPSHVQRSVLSNADHDSFILFFIVLTFYFLLKAVKAQQHRKWIESWRSPSSIRKGMVDYFTNSRTAVMYALMAGTAFGGVVMAWVGFGYVAVLILAYYIIQVVLNKFKGFDSMSVTMLIMMAMGFGYLLSFPVYYEQSLIVVRFDVPVYLFLAAMFFGIIFVVTRDIPWTLVLPVVAAVVIVGVAAISVVSPELGQAIISGQGYFVKSKLYSTIAEARAPKFSELATSFGMVTFFMSLIGLVWAVIKAPKHATAEYIFIVVWLGAAIFMAISAGRFMFNAAPAFAISAAWVLVIIVDRLDFNTVRKSIMGASGSYLQVFKKSIKVRHVVGALFLAFLIVLPNAWYSVDAGIPQQTKIGFDKQIYDSLPSFMRPGGYDKINGSMWYLGAFGYSLPLPSYYFPSAWKWFAQTDADILPETARPAYVAWWDYGFEAIQEGKHPTVADNFQNGYQLTGNVLMAQGETDAIAVFAYKLIEGAYYDAGAAKAELRALMDEYGVSAERMDAVILGPAQPLIDEVLADPIVYGPMAQDLTAANARIVTGRVELVKMGLDKLVSFYHEVQDITGWSIRYFMADSRMFPSSGRNTGIFYAPAKLSDRRIVDGSTPIDFFEIKAVTDTGEEKSFDQLTSQDTISDYKIVYKDMFYKSMFFKAMCGFSGSDIGQDAGIPGEGSLYQAQNMPGWNMTHFKMVYRTAYYNPWPTDQIAQHRDAWVAVNIDEALKLRTMIDNKEIDGYVDDSPNSFYGAGAVFLKYYDGAIVNGTVVTEQGYPATGVRVTVQDEFGIPHQTTLTDLQGHYSLIAPFGNVTLVFSTGSMTSQLMQGSSVLAKTSFNVTDDQATRKSLDLNNDGILDYLLTKDIQVKGAQVGGDVFWDGDGDKNRTGPNDEFIKDVTVFAENLWNNQFFKIDAPAGRVDAVLPVGQYDFNAIVAGRNISMGKQINVTSVQDPTNIKLPIQPGGYKGVALRSDGSPAVGVELTLTDEPSGYARTAVTDSDGNFSFDKLLDGRYGISTFDQNSIVFSSSVLVDPGKVSELNVTVHPSSTIRYRIVQNGAAASGAAFMVSDVYDPTSYVTGVADLYGNMELQVPKGIWTLYATYFSGTRHYASAETLNTAIDSDVDGTLVLGAASEVTGGLRDQKSSPAVDEYVTFEASNGARVSVLTNPYGAFGMKLPYGPYKVTVNSVRAKGFYGGTVNIQNPISNYQFRLAAGISVSGGIVLDKDSSSSPSSANVASLAKVRVTDSNGYVYTATTSMGGEFSIVFPQGSESKISLGDPGYSGWSQSYAFTSDVEDIGLVARPDKVLVTGRVTYAGEGLRGIQVSFLPHLFYLDQVTVVTEAGGYYSALVPPADLQVVIDQDTNPTGGEKYMHEETMTILPSGEPLVLNIEPVKRVEMKGDIFGASSDVQLKLQGPEEKTVTPDSMSYSTYVLPGMYNIHVTGVLGSNPCANLSSVTVSFESRQHDFTLVKSKRVSGDAKIGSSSVTKPVAVIASSAFGTSVHASSDSAGHYYIDLPPGSYSISYVLEDLVFEGRLVTYVEYFDEQVVTLSTHDVTVNPSLVMRLDNTTFSGAVYGPEGAPQQSLVRIVTNGAYGQNASFMTDASGAFSVLVQPGEYTVYATRLQDNGVSLTTASITRNARVEKRIDLSTGRQLAGKVLAADSGVELDITVTSGGTRMLVPTDALGMFSTILPEANYSLSASASLAERGMTVAYSTSTKVSLGHDGAFVTMSMVRDTKRTVTASWDKSSMQSALPNMTVNYVAPITNTGNIADTYSISYTGSTSDFTVSVSPAELSIDFGSDNKAYVDIAVTPGEKVRSGEARVSMQVKSTTSSSTRADLILYVNMLPTQGVSVTDLNKSDDVFSNTAYVTFRLNNTGNSEDNFTLQLANQDTLRQLGWSAAIVDRGSRDVVSRVELAAFSSREIDVRFTAIRSNPDPSAKAVVVASVASNPGISSSCEVPVLLPDMSIGHGDIQLTGPDVSYEYDASSVYVDLALAASLASMLVGIFMLRRKKGLGKSSSGGAKK